MDPAAKQATRERIAALRASGTTILLTTHELGDVERLADRVAILDRGRIVALGTPAELDGRRRPAGAVPPVGLRWTGRDGAARSLPALPGAGDPAAGGDRSPLRDDRPRRRSRPAAGRRAGGLVRGARAPDHGAAPRRCESRGALPGAGRHGRGGRGGGGGSERPRPPAGRRAPAVPASWLQMAMALAATELRLTPRRGESLLVTFVIPAGVLLVFSAFDTSGGTGAGQPVDRMLPGSIALAIIASSLVSLAIATGYERSYGVIKRLGGSPAGASVLVAAKDRVRAGSWSSRRSSCSWASPPGSLAGPPARERLRPAGGRRGPRHARVRRPGPAHGRDAARRGDAGARQPAVPGVSGARRDRHPARPPPGPLASRRRRCIPPAALTQVLSVGLGGGGDATESLVILAGRAAVPATLAARRFRWD